MTYFDNSKNSMRTIDQYNEEGVQQMLDLLSDDDEESCNDVTLSLPQLNQDLNNSNEDIPLISFSGNFNSSITTQVSIPLSQHLEVQAPPVNLMVGNVVTLLPPKTNSRVPVEEMKAYQNLLENCSEKLSDFLNTHHESRGADEFSWIEKNNNRLFSRTNGYSRRGADKMLGYNSNLVNLHNRYSDVRPWGHNIVSLETPIKGVSYVNASRIALEGKEFIATSAPLPTSFDHQWKMIFEQETDTVVVLTKFLERRKVKAHCYWPSKVGNSTTCGDITIECTGVDQLSEQVTVKTLNLTYNGANRSIKLFHYTGWPDFGRPEDPNEFVNLMDEVANSHQSGPIVTHCSAGCGRAGTFIAAYSYRQKIIEDLVSSGSKEEVDNFEVNLPIRILKMREQRPEMVQSEEQYVFIREVLDAAIKTVMKA